MLIETAKNLPVGGVDTLVFHYGFSIFVSTLAKVAQHALRFFFASVVSAMPIPERQLSELAESVRVFERGEKRWGKVGGFGGCARIILGKIIATLIGNGGIPREPNSQDFDVFGSAPLGCCCCWRTLAGEALKLRPQAALHERLKK